MIVMVVTHYRYKNLSKLINVQFKSMHFITCNLYLNKFEMIVNVGKGLEIVKLLYFLDTFWLGMQV